MTSSPVANPSRWCLILAAVSAFSLSTPGMAQSCPLGPAGQESAAVDQSTRDGWTDTPVHGDRAHSVLTQHNDNSRSGAYLEETILTAFNVCPGRFGKLFSRRVEGQIYAQPLYVAHLVFPDSSVHNVVYVATMHNIIYAFDADSPQAEQPLWSVSLGTPLPYNFMSMVGGILGHNIKPEIGIVSTPVIDLDAGTIFLTAKSCDGDFPADCKGKARERIKYRIHALDIVSGKERPNSPREMAATCTDSESVPGPALVTFDAAHHLQRAGLLLANGRVYAAFASHHDTRPFHGWIISYDAATLEPAAMFCTTPHSDGGAIWQAGNGLTADPAGNLYAITGNGLRHQKTGKRDLKDSFIKLSPDLQLLDWFTPTAERCLSFEDLDLGSAGAMLIPGTNLLVGGGKEGVLYLVDGDHLGGLQPNNYHARDDGSPCSHEGDQDSPPPLQSFQAARHWDGTIVPGLTDVFGYHHIHGAPVFFESSSTGPVIYVWPERDTLRAFRFDRNALRFPDAAVAGDDARSSYHSQVSNSKRGMPGGILAVSANRREGASRGASSGAESGIVWAALPLKKDSFLEVVPGMLRAFRASDLTELWNSTNRPEDDVGLFAKYTSPTVANGKVYLATFSNRLDVYGLLP